jgi:hypothetical protein
VCQGGESVLDRLYVRADRAGQAGCRDGAHGDQQVVRVDAGLGATAGGGAGQRAAHVPDLDGGQQRVGVRAGQPDQGVDRGGGEVGQERAGNVTFTPMPAVIASSMAIRPCGVPGS